MTGDGGRRGSGTLRPLPESCASGSSGCQAYFPGHHMHWIHARKIGESPWGWRDGILTAVSAAGRVEVEYALEPGGVTAWHHVDLTSELAVRTPVRVHEGLYALGSPLGWLNLRLDAGVGPVAEPEDAELWAQEALGGVVDLSTGRALPLDHLDDLDQEEP